MMTKIGVKSPYYPLFSELKEKLNSANHIKYRFNKKKGTYSPFYLFDDYKSEIDPLKLSSRIYETITKFLSENLFKKEEYILMVENILPIAADYGKDTISRLEYWNRYKLEQTGSKNKEIGITIKAFNKTSLLLLEKVNLYYKQLTPPPPIKLVLDNFFSQDLSKKTIVEIQKKFKNYNGKKMAILIYLLQSFHKKITFVYNSKTQSRKHFIRLLTNNDKIATQSIDKYFIPFTGDIKLTKKDGDYILISTELKNLLTKKVA